MKNERRPTQTIIPAEPGWENLGWVQRRLFSTRIIAWRIESEAVQCEDHSHIQDRAVAISADSFTSDCNGWVAYRDPAGRIFAQADHVYTDEAELIAELRERDQHPDNEPPQNRLH